MRTVAGHIHMALARIDAAFRVTSPVNIPIPLASAVGGIVVTSAALGALVGLCAPRAAAWLYDVIYPSDVARSVFLAPQLHLYLAAWASFHLLEFLITAYWNAMHLQADSFLLQNGIEYMAAHTFGLLEFFVEAALVPRWKTFRALQLLGVTLVVSGQLLRSLAMVHASTNFSHTVAHAKREDHVLVTHGVYSFARHPSYAGFLYWAVGTQILLGNPVSTVLFIMVLTRFFARRIQHEEHLLHHFFGRAYARYSAQVPRGVPLVRFVT